jgi:hypothetical protein
LTRGYITERLFSLVLQLLEFGYCTIDHHNTLSNMSNFVQYTTEVWSGYSLSLF